MIVEVLEPEAWTLIESTFTKHFANPGELQRAEALMSAQTPQVKGTVDDILGKLPVSYRDVTLIQLAYAIQKPGLDATKRPPGARGMGKRLGTYLKANHIKSVEDAYQNVGKNTSDLARGNYPAFDDFLRWATNATVSQLQTAFHYICARVAATAHPVKPMPQLNVGNLTFGATMGLFVQMLNTPSQGAHQQYIVACLLDLSLQQAESHHHVETKKLNTTDASSRAAGDVEVKAGGRTLEAYEVTANPWTTKLDGVGQKLRDHDLTRVHVVAPINTAEYGQIADQLASYAEDISVLDITGFVAALVHSLRKADRADALRRLYEYLDRYQPDVDRVNAYVDLLVSRQLV
ncbi:MAG: hypothetical protein ACYC5Y_13170 [Symbiobacteriia bacterium]